MKGYARCQNDIPNYKERFHHLGITKERMSVRTSATESPTRSFISICKLRFKLLPKPGDILAALDVELPGAISTSGSEEVIEGCLLPRISIEGRCSSASEPYFVAEFVMDG